MATAAGGLLATSQSFDGIREKLSRALQNVLNGREPMQDKMPNMMGDSKYCWIRDVFKNKVVYTADGVMYQREYKVSAKGDVSFPSEPVEVEITYKPIGESHRLLVREAQQLLEAGAFDAKSKNITLTVIRPGMSKNNRFYPAAVLKRDHKIFEGVKMFANHATEAEQRLRPEGDVNQWVATLKETWCESDGTVKGRAVVIDPLFATKLENLATANMLPDMGTSIRAIGEASEAEVNDTKCVMVERFVKARSVDFVTYAGAGGQVETLESDRNDEDDVELLTEARLRERRPDLIALIESNTAKEMQTVKTLEQQLQEAQTALAAATERATKAEQQLTEAFRTAAKVTAKAELDRLLTEAKLPKPAEDKLRKQFAEAEKADGMKEAIEAEREYIKAIAPAGAATQRNLGPDTQVQEGDGATTFKPEQLVESYVAMGMTEEEAKLAAGVKK